jgi:hypothetical protein
MFLHYCAHACDRRLSYVNRGAGEQCHLDRPVIGFVSIQVELTMLGLQGGDLHGVREA